MHIMYQLVKTGAESFIKPYDFVRPFQQHNTDTKVVHCSVRDCLENKTTKIRAMISLFNIY